MKYTKSVANETSVAFGMAKSTLDCSATEAFVYQFAVCGREKMRINMERGCEALFVFKEHTAHDFEWALVVKMPFPLTNREFLGRFLCFEELTGDLVLVFEALPDSTKVNYGSNLKVVRAKTTGVWRFKPINNDTQCEVTLVTHVDAGGFVPERAMVARLPQTLSGVADMRELFQRDDAIDSAKRSELAAIIRANNETYTGVENGVVDRVRDQLGGVPHSSFENFESPDHLVHMKGFHAGKNGTPRASTVLDEEICLCAAKAFITTARSKVQEFFANGGLERNVQTHSDHSFTGQQVRIFKIPTFSPREFVARVVWRWESGNVLLVVTESCLAERYPTRPGIVRASVTTLEKFERLDPVGEIPQTRVTWTQQPDMGGLIPSQAVRGAAVGQMMYVSKMRKFFDKSPAIDAASSMRLVTMIQNHDAPYTEKEEEILRTGVSHISMFEAQKGAELKMLSPSTMAKIAYEKGSSFAFGYATTTVRASPEEVLADQWDLLKRAGRAADDLEKCVDEEPSGHNKLIYIRKKTPDAIDNRDFLGRAVWRATASGFVNVTNAEESVRRPHLKGVVRGKYPSILKVTATGNGKTKLEYVIQPDFGGSMPAWAMKFYMSSNLSEVTKIQEAMQARRGLEDWDEEDAKATAEIMVTKTDAEKHHGRGETKVEARLRAIMETHEGLRELGEKHEWFGVLLMKVVANKLRPAGDSKAKLCNMSAKHANVIGGALASCIAANLTAHAAVDEWILRYPAMGELERKYVWFRPMMDTIAQRLLESVSWGLKMRLYTGAGLSTLDLLSDLNMIYSYASTPGQEGAALSLAIMVGLCLLGQLLMVLVQTHKAPKRVMIREMLVVLTGIAPGIHAMRVANGGGRDEHAKLDHDLVLTCTRGLEMALESIPGSLLQVHALLKSDDRGNKAALGSIVVSALTTGFSAATISFDFDVDPRGRRYEPSFYGYIPDDASSRTLIFGCMIINGALLLLVRSVSMALLAMVGGPWVLVYLVSDMAMYFMYKILRCDLWHWIPLEGTASVVESVLERLIVKVLVDFTGVIQFRGAAEMGGSYFAFNMIMALAASFVSTHVYYAGLEEDEEGVMKEGYAWMMVGGLSAGGICFGTAFLLLMKPGYKGTFFSTQTGYQYVQSKFLREGDENKKEVFEYNKKQWLRIRGDVKVWIVENWERWEEEKPEWFCDAWKAKVDDDMIPADSLRKMKTGQERRRSSLGDILGLGGGLTSVAPVAGGENSA
ncbi:hypothetical protein TeGR_g6242 [Tetraparma gracilis]|uniref:START domain-containing protein n=1 Tax=Tetraparma gracilis TaxID=2962635 RepID=A0ABQ6MU16_9STRA|nr:hypothetical protein TeGR_g6242 [Tetraparma gracilis]